MPSEQDLLARVEALEARVADRVEEIEYHVKSMADAGVQVAKDLQTIMAQAARIAQLEARVAALEAQADGLWRMGRYTMWGEYSPRHTASYNRLKQAFGSLPAL